MGTSPVGSPVSTTTVMEAPLIEEPVIETNPPTEITVETPVLPIGGGVEDSTPEILEGLPSILDE